MNKLTKTLLILPVIAFTTIGCGEAKPRIVTDLNPLGGNDTITVNCDDNSILEDGGIWVSRDRYPGFEKAHDIVVKEICN